MAAAIFHDRSAHRSRHFACALSGPHAGQRFQVSAVDRFAKLGAPMQVADTFAQHLPTFFACGVALTGTIDAKLVRTIERRFDAQDAALLVVEFDRVAVGLVFEAQPLGPMLEAAQHFALMIAMHPAIGLGFMAQETQHVGAPKVLDALMDHADRAGPEWRGF